MWKRYILKWLKRITVVVAILVIVASIPVLRNEGLCVVSPTKQAGNVQSLINKANHRQEINTYLTYPEWMIVHAYEDFAGITRQSSESDFHYFQSIGNYWSNLCDVSKIASSQGQISTEYRVMLYVIGLSFTAEFGVKGAYEKTLGALSAWARGDNPTPEDQKIRDISDDYARFLYQNPWYKYPFWSKLSEFWSEASWSGGNWFRKLERRFSFSMEFAVKTLYGKLIGAGAEASMPAASSVQSVIIVSENADSASNEQIQVVQQTPEGIVIETPRYRAFTEITKSLAVQGHNFREIAGNDDILVTVLFPKGQYTPMNGVKRLFTAQIQSAPGWERYGLNVKVPALMEFIRVLPQVQGKLEHIYDY